MTRYYWCSCGPLSFTRLGNMVAKRFATSCSSFLKYRTPIAYQLRAHSSAIIYSSWISCFPDYCLGSWRLFLSIVIPSLRGSSASVPVHCLFCWHRLHLAITVTSSSHTEGCVNQFPFFWFAFARCVVSLGFAFSVGFRGTNGSFFQFVRA